MNNNEIIMNKLAVVLLVVGVLTAFGAVGMWGWSEHNKLIEIKNSLKPQRILDIDSSGNLLMRELEYTEKIIGNSYIFTSTSDNMNMVGAFARTHPDIEVYVSILDNHEFYVVIVK